MRSIKAREEVTKGSLFYNTVSTESFIVKPENFVINPEVATLCGISHQRVMDFGIALKEIVARFKVDLIKANYLVSHDIPTNLRILNRAAFPEVLNYKGKILNCSMNDTTSQFKIEDLAKTMRYKAPSLRELYNIMFPTNLFSPDKGLIPTFTIYKCFKELVIQNILCPELTLGKGLWELCREFKYEIYPEGQYRKRKRHSRNNKAHRFRFFLSQDMAI